MFKFNEYFENERFAEEKIRRGFLEEQKQKELKIETQDAGWESLKGHPEVVDEYIRLITQ